nr:unnamed protein product [Digitaria exilis]
MGHQTSDVKDLERVVTDTRPEPISISYATIKYITKDFAQVIGVGGFGEVYLGGHGNWMVAVKKLKSSTDVSNEKFLIDRL